MYSFQIQKELKTIAGKNWKEQKFYIKQSKRKKRYRCKWEERQIKHSYLKTAAIIVASKLERSKSNSWLSNSKAYRQAEIFNHYRSIFATRVIKAHSYAFNLPNLKPTSLKYQVSYQLTSSTFVIKLQNKGHKRTLSYFQITEFRINYALKSSFTSTDIEGQVQPYNKVSNFRVKGHQKTL